MWQLVKTELAYFKWLFISCFVLIILINIGLTIDRRWLEAQSDFPGLRVIWIGVGIVVLFFTLLFNNKSERLRTKNLLPISNFTIGLSRWASFIIFWIALLSILIIFYLINFNGSLKIDWFVNLISITGTIFTINSIPILYSDFYNSYFKKWEKLLIGLFWIVFFAHYIALNIIFSTYFDFIAPEFIVGSRTTITNLYFSKSAIVSSAIGGALMFLATVYTFKKRKVYLK